MKFFGPYALMKNAAVAALILGTPLVGMMHPTAASATTVLKVSVPEMVAGATWVVRARVVSITNIDERARTKGARDGLFTDVQIEVLETYAGKNAPKACTMRLIGGVGADGIALTVPGMPKFKTNEEVVLFLEPTRDGFVPVGLQQGVWRVLRTPVTPPMVQQSTDGLLLMGKNEAGGLVPDAASHAKPRTQLLLGDLVRQIQASTAPN